MVDYKKCKDTELLTLIDSDDYTAAGELYQRYQALFICYNFGKLWDMELAHIITVKSFTSLLLLLKSKISHIPIPLFLYVASYLLILEAIKNNKITRIKTLLDFAISENEQPTHITVDEMLTQSIIAYIAKAPFKNELKELTWKRQRKKQFTSQFTELTKSQLTDYTSKAIALLKDKISEDQWPEKL